METIGLYSGVLSFSILCLPEVRAGKCWLKVVPLKFDIVKKQQNFASFNLRSGVPYIFCRGGKVRLIQLLDYLSAAP